MGVRDIDLNGFGTESQEDVQVTLSAKQKKIISNAMASIFANPKKSIEDKADAIGIERALNGKSWTDIDRENARKFAEANKLIHFS